MPQFHKSGTTFVVIVASLALSACAGMLEPRYPITARIPSDKSLIHFKDPLLADPKQVHISHLDAYEHVEYARYETDDIDMEAVYDVSLGIHMVLEYPYWMTRMAETWNANKGQAISWGPERNVMAWHGRIDYEPYRMTTAGRDCAAFSSEWDNQPRDSFGRPSRVFFGYICAKTGKSLSEASVAALLKSVTFDQSPVESLVPVNAHASVDQVAFNTAKGLPGSDTGNAEFPFYFGRSYWEGDGGESHTP
jgi:hypothetical protein